jgi:undecaprenyl-diphosphatase
VTCSVDGSGVIVIPEELLQSLGACDKAAFSFVQTTLRNSLFDFLMPLVSEKWNWLVPVMSVFLYFFVKDKRGGAWLLLSSVLLILWVDALATALKGEFLRFRPQQSLSELGMLIQRPASSAFPSNHAANSFALATLLAFYHPKITWVFFAAASLVAFSRVYVGNHYPLDVLGGALLGTTFAVAGAGIVRLFRRRQGKHRSGTRSIPSV